MSVLDEGESSFDLTGGEVETLKRAIKNFWRKNKLEYQPGAREKGCPPNYIRSNVSRRTVYDPDDPDNHRPKFFGKKRKPLPTEKDTPSTSRG